MVRIIFELISKDFLLANNLWKKNCLRLCCWEKKIKMKRRKKVGVEENGEGLLGILNFLDGCVNKMDV